MARATGLGGVFLRARDPKNLAQWYQQHLGLPMETWNGALLLWSDEVPKGTGGTTFAFFKSDTTYFGPGTPAGPQAAMINLRVDDLDALLQALAAEGVPIDPKRDNQSYGRFAWITDPEGNRVELWQPLQDQPEDQPET